MFARRACRYEKPLPLKEMDMFMPDETWEVFEYPIVNTYTFTKPAPNQQEMEKEGWRELKSLRRLISDNRMQTIWFRKI